MTNIILTTETEHFAEKLVNKNINIFLIDKNKDNRRLFPDGEVYVKLSKIKKIKGKTVIIHSGMPNPNQGIIELKSVLEILRKEKIGPIEIFFTYFPYGMQDHIIEEGETSSAENFIREFIKYYKVSKIYIIDAHFSEKTWVKKYPIINIAVLDLLKKEVLKEYPEIIFLAPDMGSQKRNKLSGVKKIRKNSYDIEIVTDENFKNTVNEKNIAVVDDLIETGGTMERFHKECKKNGAKKVFAICTHGVLESGIEKIKKAYSKLYLSNSINRKESNIDVSKRIINAIWNNLK